MSEHQEQVALFQALALHPECEWVFAIPNGGYRSKATAVNLRAEGVKRGVWDIFVPYPRGKYHGMYIELKYGKNKLTPEQETFRPHCEAQGYKTYVAYSWFEAYTAIMDYLGLEPKVEKQG